MPICHIVALNIVFLTSKHIPVLRETLTLTGIHEVYTLINLARRTFFWSAKQHGWKALTQTTVERAFGIIACDW